MWDDQLIAHIPERAPALRAPKHGVVTPQYDVTSQDDVRLDKAIISNASPPSCPANGLTTSHRITFKQDNAVEKIPKAKSGCQGVRPPAYSRNSVDSGLTSLERHTVAHRVANRQSAERVCLSPEEIIGTGRQIPSCMKIQQSIFQSGQSDASQHPAMILISSTKKPIDYTDRAKRCLYEYGEIHLSALGTAIETMVTLAEILKSKQLAVVTKLHTSLENTTATERLRGKSKMSIILSKSAEFDAIIETEAVTTLSPTSGTTS